MRCALFVMALACGALAAPQDDALKEFAAGNQVFTAAVYKELLKNEKGNFIVSPLSAETVLALTQEGAKDETAAEFTTGLSLPSTQEKTRQAFKSFLPKLTREEENLKLLSANRIYAGNDVKLENSFNTIATDIYKAGTENVDFSKNVEAAGTINEWVEQHTNRKIQNLIDPSSISDDTKLVLVNALYFSGQWANQFEEYETRKKAFFKTKDDTVDVDTMHLVEYLNYYENEALNAKFLELPYVGGDISMVIVLPNEKDGLTRLEQNVEQLFKPQPFKHERVDVDLPKFTIETEIKFIPILQNLGIKKVFTREADLSGLSSTHKELYVSDVIQKAFINVTETGTEAAAATAVQGVLLSAFVPDPSRKIYEFHADHPFIYLIKIHGVVAFIGRVQSLH